MLKKLLRITGPLQLRRGGLLALLLALSFALMLPGLGYSAEADRPHGLPPADDATYIPQLSGLLNKTLRNHYGQEKELAVLSDGDFFGDVVECFGPAQDERLPFRRLERFREVDRPFQGDSGRPSGTDSVKYPENPVCRGSPQHLFALSKSLFLCGKLESGSLGDHSSPVVTALHDALVHAS